MIFLLTPFFPVPKIWKEKKRGTIFFFPCSDLFIENVKLLFFRLKKKMGILQLCQTTQSKMNMLFVFILENDNAFCQNKKKSFHGIWDEPNMSFITLLVSVFSFSCFHGICLALNSLAMQNPLTIYGKTCLFHHQTNWI